MLTLSTPNYVLRCYNAEVCDVNGRFFNRYHVTVYDATTYGTDHQKVVHSDDFDFYFEFRDYVENFIRPSLSL